MNIVMGVSWSGNTLVYYPSKKDWAVLKKDKLEESTDKDLQHSREVILNRGYLIVDTVLEEFNENNF